MNPFDALDAAERSSRRWFVVGCLGVTGWVVLLAYLVVR